MTAYFSEAHLLELQDKFAEIPNLARDLVWAFTWRQFTTERAKEFALHGFCRRTNIIVRCIHNVFHALPPEAPGIPLGDAVQDATINLQAFVFNVFGAIDNLAHILVAEKNITKPNGQPLARAEIGLRKKNGRVRRALAPSFVAYLETMDPWFQYLDEFRDSLAHRIPLYVPPYAVSPDNEAAYQALENRINRATHLFSRDELDALEAEQSRLKFFRPWMLHSYSEESGIVVFHAQLNADFLTVEEIGWKVLEELEGRSIPDSERREASSALR